MRISDGVQTCALPICHDLLALVVEHRLPQELYDLRVRNAPDVGFVEPLSNAVGHDLAVEVITPLRDFGLQLLGGLSGLLAGNGRLPGFDDLLKVLGVSDELLVALLVLVEVVAVPFELVWRSEEHTSELQSLM